MLCFRCFVHQSAPYRFETYLLNLGIWNARRAREAFTCTSKIRLHRRRATSTPAGLSLFSDAIRPHATRAERAKKIFSAALSALLQAPSWRGVTRLFSAVSGARLLSVTYVAAQGIGYPKVVQCVRRGCDMIFSNFSAYFGPTRRSAPAPPPILAPHFGPTRRAREINFCV